MFERLRSLGRVIRARGDFERGMSEELRFHVEEYTDELIRSGMPPEEAARRARIEFGGWNSVKEECREARGLRYLDELTRQVRHASRVLRKSPQFTATALLTLAVCLGANLTIFAVIDSILVRPLPFPKADRLVTMYNSYPKAGVDRDGSSITNYYERRGQIPAFESLALYRADAAIVGESGSTVREPVFRVSPDFFSTLGTAPAIGRDFREAEASPDGGKVVILTDAFWRAHFQADAQVVGKQLRIDGHPITIIGVLPPGFRFLSSEAQLFLPFVVWPENRTPAQRHSGGNSKQLIARLSADATIAQAQAQLDAQNAALEHDGNMAKMLADAGFRSVVVSLHGDHVAGIRSTLLWMQAGALVLLLIGAVNLTNLLLIRANGRAKEVAVRVALGASRVQVVSETVVETVVLTLAGGVLGLAAGYGGIRLLAALGADRLPLGSHIAFDERLAAAAVAGAVVLGVAIAMPVAWFHLRGHRNSPLQSESRGGTPGRAAQRLRHAFIVVQIALALVLLTGTGLLGLSLERAMAVSPGFRADHVITGRISVPWSAYKDWPARLVFNARLLQVLNSQPGVSAVGLVNNLPLSGDNGKSSATVKGHVVKPGESVRGHYGYGVDGDYFAAMGFSLKLGRFLTADDSRRAERYCVVDDDFARYYWPDGNALGQRLFLGSREADDKEAFTVVGVVRSAKQAGLTETGAPGAVYYPYALRTDDDLFAVARTSLKPEALATVLQKSVWQVDPDVPIGDLRTMEKRLSDSLTASRSPALVASIFSVIAVLLTAIGTYGVLSYAVAQRRREIGLRMALGARPGQIRRQFLSLALGLLAVGTTLGILGSWWMGRAIRTLLFEVPSLHLGAIGAAAALVVGVSVVACLAPSERAARISPSEALAGD